MSKELHITKVAVSRPNRRTGLGRALLTTVLEAAKTGGATEAFLEVRASNRGAISFYSSLGFQAVGIRKQYYKDTGEDGVLMTNPLII